MSTSRRNGVRACLASAAVALAGCGELFHLDEYAVGDGGSALVDDGGCPRQVEASLASACTTALCVPFDNVARIPGYVPDAAMPSLPEAGAPADSGAAAGGDAAAAEAGTGLPACSSLPVPVYMIGSSGLTSIAAELGALASTLPITLVFTVAHSCDGAKAIIQNETASATGATTAEYWDVTGTQHLCEIDAASEYSDLGLGNVFADECLSLPGGASGVGDFLGPVTTGTIVAPSGSSQKAISAEALYYTVGLGAGAVAPWTSPDFIFVNPASGVQLDFGLAIGVPAAHWKGTVVSSATQNVAKVSTSAQPEGTLGTMSTDLSEAANTSAAVKELAYQDVGASCAYYPNSTATSQDKMNVRDGHYPIWGFTHMFSKVNAQNVPLNPNAATIVSYFTGAVPTPSGNFLKYVIGDHLVPVCAMRVTRTEEMGRITPYSPSPGCGCYFDSLTTGSSSCPACTTSAECPSSSPRCNLGYCEAN